MIGLSFVSYVYIMLFTDYIHVTGNLLSLIQFCVQGNADLWFGKKLNTEL